MGRKSAIVVPEFKEVSPKPNSFFDTRAPNAADAQNRGFEPGRPASTQSLVTLGLKYKISSHIIRDIY